MKQFLLALAVVVFKAMVKRASPEIRRYLKDLLIKFKERAAETPNKFDDILAEGLYDVVIGDDDPELYDE